jgi:hypothetical protein
VIGVDRIEGQVVRLATGSAVDSPAYPRGMAQSLIDCANLTLRRGDQDPDRLPVHPPAGTARSRPEARAFLIIRSPITFARGGSRSGLPRSIAEVAIVSLGRDLIQKNNTRSRAFGDD